MSLGLSTPAGYHEARPPRLKVVVQHPSFAHFLFWIVNFFSGKRGSEPETVSNRGYQSGGEDNPHGEGGAKTEVETKQPGAADRQPDPQHRALLLRQHKKE